MSAHPRPSDWRDDAACRGRLDLQSLFFPVEKDPVIDARVAELCAHCPVRKPCGKYGLADPERSGVWGGTLKLPASRLTVLKHRPTTVLPERP